MTSIKGESKNPQAFVYKDGKSKIVAQPEVEDLLNDGWTDSPDGTAKEAPEDDSGEVEVDASGTEFDLGRHYVDHRTDDDGNWLVKQGK